MGMPLVTLVAPTFDDGWSVNLRVFIDDDGGGGCTIEFWVWDAIFKPGKYTRYISLPGKTTGSTIQNHTSILGFKYQQSYFVRAINGPDSFDTLPMEYWPLLDKKLTDGQPWKINTFAHVWLTNTLNFVCTTDISCHLWLAWSDHEPYIRKRAHQKRGTVMWHDGEHGLVVNGIVEQLQSGDTRDHTIQLPFPVTGGERWWFLFGDVDNRRCNSRTPFYYDKYIPPAEALREWNERLPSVAVGAQAVFEYSELWTPQIPYTLTHFHGDQYVYPGLPIAEKAHLSIWSCSALGKPSTPQTPKAWFNLSSDESEEYVPFEADIGPLAVVPGQVYAKVWGSDIDMIDPDGHYFLIRKGTTNAPFPSPAGQQYLRQFSTWSMTWGPWGVYAHPQTFQEFDGSVP
jgi:hypothetical protein